MPHKFIGTLEELKALVREKGFVGEWRPERLITGGTKYTFRSANGGVLSWWESTGSVICQGENQDMQALWEIVKEYLVIIKR